MQTHQPGLSYEEALVRMEPLKPSDEQLKILLKELMHVPSMHDMPPAYLEHYRQAAAATALLKAMDEQGIYANFDRMQLIAGTPMMAFRVAFSKRLSELNISG